MLMRQKATVNLWSEGLQNFQPQNTVWVPNNKPIPIFISSVPKFAQILICFLQMKIQSKTFTTD